MSRLLVPTFTLVLPYNGNTTVLRDYEPALSREVHIPVLGPRDVEIVNPADSQTPIGFIVYKTEYARGQDASTVVDEEDVAERGVDHVTFWRRLELTFNRFKWFGRK